MPAGSGEPHRVTLDRTEFIISRVALSRPPGLFPMRLDGTSSRIPPARCSIEPVSPLPVAILLMAMMLPLLKRSGPTPQGTKPTKSPEVSARVTTRKRP